MTANDNNKQRYAIDIRVFLAVITTAMTIAFGVGVAFGPSTGAGIVLPGVVTSVLGDEKWQPVIDHYEAGDAGEAGKASTTTTTSTQDDEESDIHEPSGQHLLIDIKGVESAFLDSEERLAHAMVESVKAGGLTMLSYHCHKLIPTGVSCVGVLLESHISFHTWPEDGVITLDLFTCGPNPLLPVIPDVEALFAIGDNTETQWSHELRGFRRDDSNYLDNVSDLNYWILSPLEMHTKKKIVSKRSKLQQIDIWDILEVDDTPSYYDALKANLQPGDPRWTTPELATPDRVLFLDGTLQSMTSTEREYHEALVHPAMFAHPGPKRVALIGGGEGATLREVLKHKTIESAVMIEMDEELVALSREFLPQMSDCSDLVGRAANCFDDDLVTLVHTDGRQWFVDRFGTSVNNDTTTTTTDTDNEHTPPQKFDVVIVDALDPEDDSVMSESLYSDDMFLTSLLTSLSDDDGVLIIQVGTAANIHEPRADLGVYQSRERLFRMLEDMPTLVEAMFVYEEAHCGFLEPHSFLVVCRNAQSCRSRWWAESDTIDYQVYDRILQTHSKDRPLVHYDGSTHFTYRFPPKAWETVYCRREPMPEECHYMALDPKVQVFDYKIDETNAEQEAPDSAFHAEWLEKSDSYKVTANVDIPQGSYIMPTHLAASFMIGDDALSNLRQNTALGGVTVIEGLLDFIDANSHYSTGGLSRTYVEIGASFLMATSGDGENDGNVGKWMPLSKRPVYSPVFDRHHVSFDVFLVATRDIKEGEELVKKDKLWE